MFELNAKYNINIHVPSPKTARYHTSGKHLFRIGILSCGWYLALASWYLVAEVRLECLDDLTSFAE